MLGGGIRLVLGCGPYFSAVNWWLRSPYCNSSNGATNALNVNSNGNWNNNNCSNTGWYLRPALVESETSSEKRKQCAINQRGLYPIGGLCMSCR